MCPYVWGVGRHIRALALLLHFRWKCINSKFVFAILVVGFELWCSCVEASTAESTHIMTQTRLLISIKKSRCLCATFARQRPVHNVFWRGGMSGPGPGRARLGGKGLQG